MHHVRPLFPLLVAVAWLAACAGPQAPVPQVEALAYTARATNAVTVVVDFSGAVDDAAAHTSSYAIVAEGGGRLPVLGAILSDDRESVMLATSTQEPGTQYTLTVSGVSYQEAGGSLSPQNSSFGGSSERAPILASAIALGPNEVLLTFAAPSSGMTIEMSDLALDPRFYDIVEASPTLDETPDLSILPGEGVPAVRFGVTTTGREDRSRVILHTETQTDTHYTLRVANLTIQAGDKLIDPENSSVGFRGIPEDDEVPPSVTRAVSVDNTHVLIEFSEPVVSADRADRYRIVVAPDGDDAPELAVLDAEYTNPYGTHVLLTTAPQSDERTTYLVTVTGVTDKQGNPIESGSSSYEFQGVYRTGPIDGDLTPPRVSNTGSTGANTVLVTFSEPVDEASATVASHYRIWADLPKGQLTTQATLAVTDAALSDSRTTVTLTTMAQSDLLYTLEVTNVTDLAGNQIAPPDRFHDPSSLTFRGISGSGNEDSDCDGLSDAAEQRGWIVEIQNADGTVERVEVTSDPGVFGAGCEANAAASDTDGDLIDDATERIYLLNPRDADTDHDGLTDDQELNDVYSEPAMQDSDGDGLNDGLEWDFFGTSPLLEDTDGDQLTDGDEVALQNRNPLIADLPSFDVRVVGDVQLDLDVRFTATDETGSRHLETRTSEGSLATEASSSQESGSSSSSEWFINGAFNLETGYDGGFKFLANLGVDGGYREGTTTEFTSASARAIQQAQTHSLTTDVETEAGESVTREVVDATMAISVEFENLGDIAFTLENVELIAKVVDPRDPSRFVPVATLVGTAGSYTLGPAPDVRGPARFVADDPSPALVEQLRENPRNLLFEVANYDVSDEFGRNFSYTYQDVNDRTATLLIDYGGRLDEEVRRVATHSGYDDGGRPLGVDMRTVMETILDLEFVPSTEDGDLRECIANGNCTAAERARAKSSYSTELVGGVTVLYRVRDVMNDADKGLLWIVSVALPPGTVEPDDFNDLVTTSGRFFRFLFGQDLDGDGLTAQQEAMYGSIDSDRNALNNACFGDPTATNCGVPDFDRDGNPVPDSRDTDQDGISDDQEVFGRHVGGSTYDPWTVAVRGEDAYRTSSSPARPDTDGDGLTDCQEFGFCGIFPYVYASASTSVPGAAGETQATLRRGLENDPQNGTVVGLFIDATGRPGLHPDQDPAWALVVDVPERTDPSRFDTDVDGVGDRSEIIGARYLPLDAAPGDHPVQLLPTEVGEPDVPCGAFTGLDADDLLPCHATDPLNADTDYDVLSDGAEIQIGSDPTDPDSTRDGALDQDGDGLRNIEEDVGWIVVLRRADGTWVDTDGSLLKTDVGGRLVDADDRLVAVNSFGNPVVYDGLVLASGGFAPARVTSDRYLADTDGDGLSDGQERDLHTDPRSRDTDGDGLTDREELEGTDFPSDSVSPVRFPNFLAHDSDGDGLSDGDEANDPWIVQVTGEDPYLAYSDPTRADVDLDGLGDALEKSPVAPHGSDDRSDPNRADTDGDGIADSVEIAWTHPVDGSITRSPAAPDQVVEFRYSNATMLESCYLVPGEASLDGWIAQSNGFFTQLAYSRFGGIPGGYAWVQAADLWFGSGQINLLTLRGPSQFRGDQSAHDAFTFDMRQYLDGGDQTSFDPRLYLRSGDLTLVYDHDPADGDGGTQERHTATNWTRITIPLVAAAEDDAEADSNNNWAVVNGDGSTGDLATAEQLDGVLSDIDELRISGAYESPETFWSTLFAGVGFDNPRFGDSPESGAYSAFDDGQLASGNFQGSFHIEAPAGNGSLTVNDLADAQSTLSQTRSGQTVGLDSDTLTFVVGLEQGFRAFSSNLIEESESYTLGIDQRAYANYGNFTTSYTYPVVGGNGSTILRGQSHDNARSCELGVSWTWRVVQ